ncbi:GNAT family N-acetyltransferase [Trinickia acidisoli]|uniref:GNAT family N-acetyltransferase n=1 Tax=Trinickia acidisoli TaxID=2767482 RepID=UPI001A8D6AE6|nr:GNAT family N-acetyltransferase [Trinickia acidisoli]
MPLPDASTLSTARLRLRPLCTEDAAPLFTMYSDTEFMRYWSFPAMTRFEQAVEYLTRRMQGAATETEIVWVVELAATHEVIGTCSLFNADATSKHAEIGFGLLRPFWGHGYMSEAARAAIDCGFDVLQLHRIEAEIDPRNTASARVLERLGFVREGLLRERWIIDGEISDGEIYGLLRTDRR